MKNCEKYTTVDAREKAFREYDRQETIADIVSEMRNEGHTGDASCLGWVGAKMQRYADRIEAAANHRFREVTKMIPHEEVAYAKTETATPTSEKSSAVGNAAEMREALMEASIALSSATHHHLTEDDAKECLAVIESALSKPPRNCDIGTEEEQVSRYNKFCMRSACNKCPFYVASDLLACGVRWSQIPYMEVK